MCGICGFYDYKENQPADSQSLTAMLHVLHHRGPDDSGAYLHSSLALGMRRLSIIDLEGGKQPIFNEDGSIVTVFNGEIYNYRALRAELQSRGHIFSTDSDTEVIVHLYEDYGEDCIQKLRGMFGLAVWDSRRRKLFLARDRLGIKPLYYAEMAGCLIFASEIKAILEYPGVARRLNLKSLSNFISLKYVPAPQTMFEGIFALPPGCALSCDANGVRVRRYWDLSFTNSLRGINENECAEQLEALLRECVQLHLVSDVPFGAFLSGGMDSSTIVALMSQFLNQPVKTYSVGFSGDAEKSSELPYARLVARKYHTDHHEVFIRASDLLNHAEKVIWHLDQPIADEAALANYMVADLASRDVKMVLTGEGGDELFAGYARYVGERFSPLFQAIPRDFKSAVLRLSSQLPGIRRQKIALYALCQSDELTRLVNWFPLFNSDMKRELLAAHLRHTLNGEDAKNSFKQELARTNATDSLSRMLYVDTKLWLPDDLLARGDKTSMAASVEARLPLLDHKLVEFAASLPSHLKVKGFTRKYLLRKVAGPWLPPEIIRRKKKGFPMPISLWLRGEARPFLRDVLSPAAIRRRGLFNSNFIEKLIREHESGFALHGSLLWALLSVELWQRLFLDTQSAPERHVDALAARA